MMYSFEVAITIIIAVILVGVVAVWMVLKYYNPQPKTRHVRGPTKMVKQFPSGKVVIALERNVSESDGKRTIKPIGHLVMVKDREGKSLFRTKPVFKSREEAEVWANKNRVFIKSKIMEGG